jgi:hypothetical protein
MRFWCFLFVLFGLTIPASADLFDQPPPFFDVLTQQTSPPFIPISIDGTPQLVSNTTSSTMTVTYSTASTNEIILVNAACILGSVSIADTAGLTWVLRQAYHPGAVDDLEEWYAYAPIPLVSDSITVTCSQVIVNSMTAVAVIGLAVGSPYDSNASLPAVNSGSGSLPATVTVFPSTSHANDMLLCIYASGIAVPLPCTTGFTDLGSGGFIGVSYKIVNTLQSHVNITTGSGYVSGMIGDAGRGN